uniref:Phosphate regulon transcriptional regulatory protein PhoB n=1 Tax=uncultured Thiotrichaceae bacterium TaxID=298394 RepID=A0A6S6TKC4_9GAMM|nr:MAG: Phosphate regulon transcriptional regulatory protein PhoB (SphR) [uncultured Thiotrichaceae bacterium]
MAKKQILLVEDEVAIRQMIRIALERHDYEIIETGDVAEARVAIADRVPDLLLVDWMLPDQPGPELIKQLRAEKTTRTIPIIMLTARAEENDMIQGLEAGADDYIYKPLSLKNLHARIKALLRRSEAQDNTDVEKSVLKSGDIELDTHSLQLNVAGTPVHFGITEFRLLEFLMQNAGRVYSRAQLLDAIWGQNSFIEERTVDVHILRLRKALKKQGADKAIKTIRGAGYLFEGEVTYVR